MKSLHDVALDPNLGCAAADFERLLRSWRQADPEVDLDGRIWRRATGLAGPAGLTLGAGGRCELVFDPVAGVDLKVVTPSRVATYGGGCAPVLGTRFSIKLLAARPTSGAVLLLSSTRTDVPLAVVPLGLANDRSLLGLERHAQWVVADPGGAFGPGVAAFTGGWLPRVGDG